MYSLKEVKGAASTADARGPEAVREPAYFFTSTTPTSVTAFTFPFVAPLPSLTSSVLLSVVPWKPPAARASSHRSPAG